MTKKSPASGKHYLRDDIQRLVGGLANLLPLSKQELYQTQMSSTFPELSAMMEITGYDWLGRPFGVSRVEVDVILLYDGIFDELMEFTFSKDRLDSSSLFDPTLNNFGIEVYESFLAQSRLAYIEFGSCAGFTIPPQLGGEVAAGNLELYPVFAYWNYVSLLHDALADLPEGTILKSLRIE